MPTGFENWKRELLDSAGDASPPVRRMGDYVLELLWKDGCEPTMAALMDYAQAGLCRRHEIHASDRNSDSLPQAHSPNDTARR